MIGKVDLKDAIDPYLSDWKWSGTVDEILRFWFGAEHSVDQRILNVIKDLQSKGVKCCLLTNQEKYRTKYMKKEMGFEEIFDDIFSSAEIGHKKPEKEIFEFALEKLKGNSGIKKEEVLFVDDDLKNIEAARDLGIKSHHYQDFDEFEKEIKSLIEIGQ